MILFVKHINIEGPETLEDFFINKGFDTKIIDLSFGDKLPDNLDGLDAVVFLGGPMNVYEEDKYPFLKDDNIFLKKIINVNLPFLGLCLGSQLLSKASGGKIVKSPIPEIGFSRVSLNQDGLNAPLFEGLDMEFDVFQWHGDMFELSSNGILLAKSQVCPNQAFRVGKCAYGLQFHIEITQKSIEQWSDAYLDMSKPISVQTKQFMSKEYMQKKESFGNISEIMYNNFLKIINNMNS